MCINFKPQTLKFLIPLHFSSFFLVFFLEYYSIISFLEKILIMSVKTLSAQICLSNLALSDTVSDMFNDLCKSIFTGAGVTNTVRYFFAAFYSFSLTLRFLVDAFLITFLNSTSRYNMTDPLNSIAVVRVSLNKHAYLHSERLASYFA